MPKNLYFHGSLRPEQIEIRKETIQALNDAGSCIMAIYPGGGKCLGRGTRLLTYRQTHVNVEDVKIGDLLCGPDYQPRTVMSVCMGNERMYRIQHESLPFMDYRVNASHILTVFDIRVQKIVDINVEFLYLNDDPKFYLGVICCSDEDKPHLDDKMYEGDELFDFVRNGYVAYFIESGYHVVKKQNSPFQYYRFSILQEKEDDEYFGFTLLEEPHFLLSSGICTHNTITSLNIARHIGLKTMIFVNKIVLIAQWKETIEKCFRETPFLIEGKSKSISKESSFYIMNALNVGKHGRGVYEELGIGLLIVDECHLILTKVFSKALAMICPRYLLGLSATPFRPDGFDQLFDLYFGIRRIVRRLYRPHDVIVIKTNIVIEAEKDKRGDIVWNSVIEKQVQDKKRNDFIAELCEQYFEKRNILILSKRIHQIVYLHDLLKEKGVSVTCMKESDSTYDASARVLISTFQKVGTGFSHDKMDMLILASDVEEYFMQYLGRVFRRPDVRPIILDLIDENGILKKHFDSRRKIYKEAGGQIQVFTISSFLSSKKPSEDTKIKDRMIAIKAEKPMIK